MVEFFSHPAVIAVIAGVLLLVLGSVGKLLVWIGKVEEQRGTVAAFMVEIRGQLKEIFLRLPSTPEAVTSNSPLMLTDFGRKMADSMDATKWAVTLAPTLKSDIVGKRDFEIDVFSRDYVKEHMRDDERVAKCMYEMGAERDNVLKVLYVVLRDELLRLRSLDSPTETL